MDPHLSYTTPRDGILLTARYVMLALAAAVYWVIRFLTARLRIERERKQQVWWQIRGWIYSITSTT